MVIPNPIRFIPPPTALGNLLPFLDEAKDVLENPGMDLDNGRLLATYCLRYALKLAEKKYSDISEADKRYVDQLRLHCENLGNAASPGFEETEVNIENKSEETKIQTLTDEEAKHREVITNYARKVIEKAEKLEDERGNQLETGRIYHTAVVFLQVLKVFGDLSKKTEEDLKYCHWKTRLCSHILENCVLEHDREQIQEKYIINENDVLGRGSYGVVCTVVHKITNVKYACKILHINRTTPRYVAKLHEEIAIMRELDHPNIVALHEVFYEKRKIYLVMDLCTGGELYQYVANHEGERLAEAIAASLTIQMLSAIKFMHQSKIVHRDLKLENWLLETKEPGSHLKLVDFGLSKHFAQNHFMTHQVGSIFYVAPEVLQGEYTEKCDLWSTGVIVYMILSGIPPFWGRNDSEIQREIFSKQVVFPASHFADVSELAKDFILNLLVRDEKTRLSAEGALGHPWLSSHKHISREISFSRKSDVATSILEFSQTNNFVRVISEIAAFNLTPQQIVHMRNIFHEIDTDNSGTISIEELRKAIFNEHHDIGGKEFEKLFEAVNITHTHEIRYHEFIAATMWNKIHFDEERFQEIFDSLDTEHTGFLTNESIRNAVGVDFSEQEIDKMIKDADYNGDEKIDYQEFVRLWKENAFANTRDESESLSSSSSTDKPKKRGILKSMKSAFSRLSSRRRKSSTSK